MNEPIVVDLDVSQSTLENTVKSKKDYRIISLSAFGSKEDAHYAVVWAYRPYGLYQVVKFGTDIGEVSNAPLPNFAPTLIAIKGALPSSVFFAAVYEEKFAVSQFGVLPVATIGDEVVKMREPYGPVNSLAKPNIYERFISSAGIIGDGIGGRLVAFVSRRREKGNKLYWNLTVHDDHKDFDVTRKVLKKARVRPAHFDFDEKGGLVALWYDDMIEGALEPALTTKEKYGLEAAKAFLVFKGAQPQRIAAYGPADNPQYAILYAKSDEPIERKLRIIALPNNVVVEQPPQPPKAEGPLYGMIDALAKGAEDALPPEPAWLDLPWLQPPVAPIDSLAAGDPGSNAVTRKPSPPGPTTSPISPSSDLAMLAVLEPGSILPPPGSVTPKKFFSPYRPVSDLDNWVIGEMKRHNIRGAQLAITQDTRLVFCRAYTWAEPEPHYPTLLPTHGIRLWSISKVIAYITLMRVLRFKPPGLNGNWPLETPFMNIIHENYRWGLMGLGKHIYHKQKGDKGTIYQMPPPPALIKSNPALFFVTLGNLMRHDAKWSWTYVKDTLFQSLKDVGDAKIGDPKAEGDYPNYTAMNDLAKEWKVPPVVDFYNSFLWPQMDSKWQPPIRFWDTTWPIDPRTFLAYLLSYAVVGGPTKSDPIYQNADTAILAAIVEQIVNPYDPPPWGFPLGKKPKNVITYPDIVTSELWQSLNPIDYVAQEAILSRIGMQNPVNPVANSAPQHSKAPRIGSSFYDLRLIPAQDYFDAPRTLGAAGGWIAPAVDVARILACLHATLEFHPNAPLLTYGELDAMWSGEGVVYKTPKNGEQAVSPTKGGWFQDNLTFYQSWNYPTGTYTVLHHNGSGDGGTTIAMRRSDGLGVVLLFNQGLLEAPSPYGYVEPAYLDIYQQGYRLMNVVDKVLFPSTDDFFDDPTVGYSSFVKKA